MSLINRVLKDLEARHASSEQGDFLSAGVRALPAVSGSRKWFAVGGLAAVGILMGVLVSFELPRFSKPLPATPKFESLSSSAREITTTTALPPSAGASTSTMESVTVTAPTQQLPAAVVDSSGLRMEVEINSPVQEARVRQKKVVVAHLAPKANSRVLDEPIPRPMESSRPSQIEATPAIEKSMLGPTARERAQEALEQGLLALRKKERATAGKFFRAAVVADPTFDRGRQALISLLLEADLKDSAEALAVDGIAQGAAKATFALIAARLKLEHGAAKDAIALLEQEQAGGKSNADYLALWANALTREHRFREAAAKYADAVALAPTNPAHQVGLAYALRNDGQYVAAHEVFSRVHAMEGINPQLANLVDLQLQSLRRFLTAAPASAPRSNP